MSKPKKLGKDVLGKSKGVGIIRTKKQQEEYEEYKRRKAEEEEERKRRKQKKPIIKSKLPEDKEPSAEDLAKQKADVLAGMRVKKIVLKKEEE